MLFLEVSIFPRDRLRLCPQRPGRKFGHDIRFRGHKPRTWSFARSGEADDGNRILRSWRAVIMEE